MSPARPAQHKRRHILNRFCFPQITLPQKHWINGSGLPDSEGVMDLIYLSENSWVVIFGHEPDPELGL